MRINSVNNVSTMKQNNNQKPSFSANLKLHKEVTNEVMMRAMAAGKNPINARQSLYDIYLKAADKVKPMLPDVDVIIGSTRKAIGNFMVYTQSSMKGAPKGLVSTKEFGDINLENPDEAVKTITSATDLLLWGERVIRAEQGDN